MTLFSPTASQVACPPLEPAPFEQMQEVWEPFVLLATQTVDLDCWQVVIQLFDARHAEACLARCYRATQRRDNRNPCATDDDLYLTLADALTYAQQARHAWHHISAILLDLLKDERERRFTLAKETDCSLAALDQASLRELARCSTQASLIQATFVRVVSTQPQQLFQVEPLGRWE